MAQYEYKTVALPRSVNKRRRRRQTEADLVAEQLGKTLNEEAVDGWEYVQAETLTTPGQRSLLKHGTPAAYVVLIFKRAREATWQRSTQPTKAAPSDEPRTAPTLTPQASAPAQSDPSDVRFGSTSVQLVSNAEGSVTPMRPPLGSAQD
jgi:hypothetical protein